MKPSKYTAFQKIERSILWGISQGMSLFFSPNYTRPFSWWAILGFFIFLLFVGYITSILPY